MCKLSRSRLSPQPATCPYAARIPTRNFVRIITPFLTSVVPSYSRPGTKDKDADFGNGWYNDHHYHYGYTLYAIAVAARFDPSFGKRFKPYWLSLAYDIANPLAKGDQGASGPASPLFPLARHKDFYDGHSWASGLFDQANSKSQESVSEATNAYYGVSRAEAAPTLGRALPLPYQPIFQFPPPTTHHALLLALYSHCSSRAFPPSPLRSPQTIANPRSLAHSAGTGVALLGWSLGDSILQDFGRLLLAMEVSAAQLYWQIRPDSVVYPSSFSGANSMVGVVGATNVRASTWFGANVEYVHCINMMPFTPGRSNAVVLAPLCFRAPFTAPQLVSRNLALPFGQPPRICCLAPSSSTSIRR